MMSNSRRFNFSSATGGAYRDKSSILAKSKNEGTNLPKDAKPRKISKSEARSALARIQSYMGFVFLVSAAAGVYLLASDGSLWKLAISHAYGLVSICTVDIILSGLNFFSVRKVYLASVVWAILTVLLQLGDVLTAPQYKMTMGYFASYLFHLWAFDLLLASQVVISTAGLLGRSYLKYQAKKKLTYFDMGISKSRRDFIQIMGSITALVAIAGIVGAIEALGSHPASASVQPGSTTTTSDLPAGAIANVNKLETLSPVYFDYPSAGDTNVLFKKSDGTVAALSTLCTHVCCTVNFDPGSKELYCPCHGSVFNDAGGVLRGPAPTPLPSIELRIDEYGNIYPTGIKGTSPCLG